MSQLIHRLAQRWLLPLLLLVAILVWLAVLSTPEPQLVVSFLDVGQGDAIFIQTPSRQQILVDGGADPEKICLELGKRLPFWDRSIDLIVLTQPQDDHLVGLIEVLRRYKTRQVLDPGVDNNTVAYDEWLKLIAEKGIERVIAHAGQQINLSHGITIDVLNPQEDLLQDTDSDINNNSVVLRLAWKEISFLLTGDIQEMAEREMLYRGVVSLSTVLKVAHHGSAGSTGDQFLTAVAPQVAVISVGKDNPFGHPAADTLDRIRKTVGAYRVYLTSEQGSITFTTDGERLWVETEKPRNQQEA